MAFLKIETELTSGILKKKRKDPKTHKRSERTLFTQTKQDRMRILEEILFFKATNNTKTDKSFLFLTPVGFLHNEMGTGTPFTLVRQFRVFLLQKSNRRQKDK